MANTTEQHGHLDFLKTAEIQNAIIQKLTSAPSTPSEAQIYWDTTLDTFRIYDNDNTAWISMLKDGDYGDITIGTGETALTINDEAVTLAKMAHIATNTFLGRDTAATGDVEVLTTVIATSMLELFATGSTVQGLVPGSNGGSTLFLRGDSTWASPAGGFADFDAGGDNGANVTVADGNLYDVTGNTGLKTTISKAATTVTLDVELELDAIAEKTGNLVAGDRLTGVSGTTHFSETISAIPLSIFDNDDGWTNNTGTVTSVSAGNGLDFSSITVTGDVILGTPSTLTSATSNAVTATSHTHSLDISGFASTVLSDTADIAYLNQNETIVADWTVNTGQTLTITDAPTAGTDAANKAYVDGVAQGLDTKESVVVNSDSTSSEGTGYSYNATGGASGRGQITWSSGPTTIDGVTLSNTDRILNSETGAASGIYVRTAANTWDRATDFDEDAEVTASAFVFIEEGTAYADTGWTLSTNDPIIIGGGSGTSLTWVQFSGAGSYSTGNGLTEAGTVFSLGTPSTLTGSTTNGTTASSHTHAITTGIADNDIVEIDSASVATGEYARFTVNGLESRTIAEVQSELGIITKYTEEIGDTSTTLFTITHNLGTRDVIVRVRETSSPYTYIDVPIESDTTNAVGIDFLTAPGTNEYTVIVIG